MRCKVLKAFPLAADGRNNVQCNVDEYVDVPVNLVNGLEAEGFIKKAPGRAKEDMVPENKAETPPENKVEAPADTGNSDIPADWRDLAWPKLRALASSLGGKVTTKDDAIEAIEAHLAASE